MIPMAIPFETEEYIYQDHKLRRIRYTPLYIPLTTIHHREGFDTDKLVVEPYIWFYSLDDIQPLTKYGNNDFTFVKYEIGISMAKHESRHLGRRCFEYSVRITYDTYTYQVSQFFGLADLCRKFIKDTPLDNDEFRDLIVN